MDNQKIIYQFIRHLKNINAYESFKTSIKEFYFHDIPKNKTPNHNVWMFNSFYNGMLNEILNIAKKDPYNIVSLTEYGFKTKFQYHEITSNMNYLMYVLFLRSVFKLYKVQYIPKYFTRLVKNLNH